MMVKQAGDRNGKGRQSGHLLILLMVGLTVMLIMLTVAAQSWTFQMRREMEKELIFRGEQYINGLLAFRKANGNAFPVGDLKVLAQKNMTGVRFMRKLYKNPMDPNGTWQYLYLHPGGTGFINPCAVGGGIGFNDPRNNPMRGQVPVGGFGIPMGGSNGMGLRPGQNGGASLNFGRQGSSSIAGTRSTDEEDGELPAGPSLSAMDPKTFKSTGIQKMNLPIVGVVNCQMVESISTYKGQSYLSNWAFTPLAQGEFGANAQPGGLGAAAPASNGLGLSGSSVFLPGQRQRGGDQPGVFSKDNPWSRDGKQRAQPPPDDDDSSYVTGSDPNRRSSDPNDPNRPSRNPGDPNRAAQDPNRPARNPNDPNGRPQDPNQSVHDPNAPGDVEPGDEEDDSEDSGDEDPNSPGVPSP